jgi:methionyl-tRNA formyltransferase
VQKTEFARVIIIGYGVVTADVLQYVFEKSKIYDYYLEYIEYEVHPFNTAQKYAEKYGIVYHRIQEKSALTSYFMNIDDKKTLIISASNNYLFTKELLEKKNIVIINFHNALLPKYPGRNAPSWVIYDESEKTGITWHYVTSGIDEGNIIIQKECEITPNVKAYELVATLMHFSSDAFKECFEDVICERVDQIVQSHNTDRKVYKSNEVPGGGRFDLSDTPRNIFKLLRAMDYGKNNIFPYPITEYQGNLIRIRRYKIVSKSEVDKAQNVILISYDKEHYLQMKYDICETNNI